MKTSVDGEKLPKLGGQTYCNWKLTNNFLQDIIELITQARCWRYINNQINNNEVVPKFKIQTVFAK